MANAVYPKALEGFLKADIDMDSDIRLALVDAGAYTYSATHQFVSDLSGVIARSTALQSKTMTGGAFDCDDIVVTGVSGASIEIVVCFLHTGSDATARLISFHDRDGSNNPLSLTPDGGNVNVTIPAGGLFAI